MEASRILGRSIDSVVSWIDLVRPDDQEGRPPVYRAETVHDC